MRTHSLQKNLARLAVVCLVLQNLFLSVPDLADAATQNAYRWRNDDGSETAATYAAAENTPLSGLPKSQTRRLRFGLANNGSETEILERAIASGALGDDLYRSGVIDTAAGFAYYGTQTDAGRIVKIRLSDFTRIGAIDLPAGESRLNSAVIDTVNGFAYFGSAPGSGLPGKIIKIDLATFTRVSSITLGAGETDPDSAVIDVAGGFAYFSHLVSPGIVSKIQLSTFTEVGALTFASGENNPYYASIIDPSAGFAYFGLFSTGKLIKVSLASFTEVGTLTLTSGTLIGAAVIDTTTTPHYAYVGVFTSPAKISKIDLTTFTEVAVLTLNSGDNSVLSYASIDTAAKIAYFQTFTTPGRIVKIDVNPANTFAQIGTSLTLAAGENSPNVGLIDPAAGFGYFGTYTSAGHIVKVTLSSLTSTTSLTPGGGETNFTASAVDAAAGFGYFGTNTSPAKVVKMRLSDLAMVGTLTMTGGEDLFRTGAIDAAGGFVYFASNTTPAKVVKVRLSDFTAVATLTLASGENLARSSAIDPAAGFLYIGLDMSPGKVAKISLATFTESGSPLSFGAGEAGALGATIDTVSSPHFAYFTLNGSPGKVAKVDLSTFLQVGTALSLSAGSFYASAIIDTTGATHFAYFGSGNNPGRVAKVNLTSFTEVAVITLGTGEGFLDSGVIDATNGFAYFGADIGGGAIGKVMRIDLTTFTKTATIDLTAPAGSLNTSFVDPVAGFAYFGTFQSPGKAVKISIAPKVRSRLEYGVKSSTCGAIGSWTQVPTSPGAGEHWQMSNSANVTDGAVTTDAAGVSNGNTSFTPGRIHDVSSQTAELSYGRNQFTEVEYSIRATGFAADSGSYCFRLTDAGSAAGFTFTQYAEASLSGVSPTVAGQMILSRLKVSTVSSFLLSFGLTGTSTGNLVVTFPAGFTVTAAANGGASSGCLSGFGFTAQTLTASKTDCSGTVILGGAAIVNPATPGQYVISWSNDSGSGTVVIVSDDQVNVNASVDPAITFNVGAQASATACAGSFSGNGGTVALGILTTSSVASSDASSVSHICTRLSTNGAQGASVTVRSANASLASTSAPADTIPSSTTTLVAGTAGYGLCAGSAGADSGFDATTPAGVAPTGSAPFNGSCTSSAHVVGGLTTSAQNVWTVPSATQNAFMRVYIKAAISTSTPAHSDYTDTLTFVATGTF